MKTLLIRERAHHAGTWVSGTWQPAGAAIATLTITEPIHPDTLRELVARIERAAPPVRGLPDETAWEVEVEDSEIDERR